MFIHAQDAEKFITEEFYAALDVFVMSENMECLPFAGGWAEQPEWITQAISILKGERFKVNEEEKEIKEQEQKGVKKHG